MMKKYLLFFGAIVLFSATLFISSCSSDNTTADLPPTIEFVTGTGYISTDVTLTVDSPYSIKILAQANTTSGAKLETLKVSGISNNVVVLDTTYSIPSSGQTTFPVTFSSNAMSTPGVMRIEFKVTDKDGQSATISLQITTQEASGGAIDTWTERILGSWNNPTGSSFASINGNVYTLDQAFANQSIIDYMYWWAASTNSATIGAPDDPNAAEVFNTGDYKLANWTIKNATRFKTTTVTSTEFDNMTFASDFIPIATGADQTRLANLAVDQVIAFISVTNKHGLIRIKNFTAGSDGTMTIDVKVEK